MKIPNEESSFSFWNLLLHVKGAPTYKVMHSVNAVLCLDSREACKMHVPFADDSQLVQALAEVFRPRYGPITHMFARILANCKRSIPQDVWDSHCRMFIMDTCNSSKQFEALLEKIPKR